jgi:hypothetical protein
VDEDSEQFGGAVPLFMDTLAEPLAREFTDNRKRFPQLREKGASVTAYCEVYSDNSFAGWFPQENGKLEPVFPTAEPAKIALIDVNIYKRGFMLPRDFIKAFGEMDHVAQVVYEGNFNKQFMEEVRQGKCGSPEGVVAKGVILGKKKNDQHGLWMSKVKTLWWLAELKRQAQQNIAFRQALAENIAEQGTS